MTPDRDNLIACLYAELASRTRPLPIALGEHKEIQGIATGFNATLDYSCVFHHPERMVEIGFNSLTRRVLLKADTPTFATLAYEAKEAFLREKGLQFGIAFDEYDPPWTWHSDGPNHDEAMTRWLDEPFGGEVLDEEELLVGILAGEYLPGFAILNRMAQTDVHRLGMKTAGIGGPASTVGAVIVKCSPQDLNEALRRNDLPFEVTEATCH